MTRKRAWEGSPRGPQTRQAEEILNLRFMLHFGVFFSVEKQFIIEIAPAFCRATAWAVNSRGNWGPLSGCLVPERNFQVDFSREH